MKKNREIIRILCSVVDFLIIMVPIQFIMMGVFQVSVRQADLLFQLLFAVYGTLLTEYMGMTIGKYFGRLKVTDISGIKPAMLYVGLRELTKAIYFIPYIGWAIGFISIMMMLIREDGRTLHDFVGNTTVVYSWQIEREKEAGKVEIK